ncbi:MAG: TonB-dependent receptor, partial [Bacteroidota bacterium]
MNLIRRTGAWLACLILLPAFAFAQQGTVSGTVTDALTGDPLPGANVILTEPGGTTSSLGAATDFDGNYTVANVPAGSYDLIARFIGYNESRQPVTVTAGQTVTINVALDEQGVGLNTVVVTASRQQEKVLDAPAAISVLSARDVEEQGTTSAAGVLRNVTGLDASQTGADRVEIALRGFNNAFSGAAFTLVDYRQASIASLGVNSYNAMPISNIDIDRVEVVRGPGSALYGAGVDSGVIHFITKGPFSSPGTTVSVYGGQRSMAGVNFRHAGVVNENLGYKVTGTFAQVDDWELDPSDPEDAVQLSSDAVARDYAADKFNLGGQLEFRPDPATSLVLNGGYSQSTNIYLSGIGTLQGDEFGYSYGQVRLQSGGLFAQAFLNMNNAGNSFVYGTGEAVVDNSTLFNAQAQYDMELFEGRNRLIFGA